MIGEQAATPTTPPMATASVQTETTFVRRIVGAAIAVPAAAVLFLAAWLTPSSAGLGTHEQMGLPACGWVTLMDIPCPTCGMTTSFSHAADGNLWQSFLTQPVGFVLAMITAMALLCGVYVMFTGSTLLSLVAQRCSARLGWIAGGCLLIAWIYKIVSHKGLL
jgi:hypothetical protein